MVSGILTKCCYAERLYAEWHCTEWHCTEWYCTEWHCTEWHCTEWHFSSVLNKCHYIECGSASINYEFV
jgi:hypothetical protein